MTQSHRLLFKQIVLSLQRQQEFDRLRAQGVALVCINRFVGYGKQWPAGMAASVRDELPALIRRARLKAVGREL